MSIDLSAYLKETFGIDELYLPLVGRAPWGVNIELTYWTGDGGDYRNRDEAVAKAERVLDFIQNPDDQMVLVACYSGYGDEPAATATSRFIKRPDWVGDLRCEAIEMASGMHQSDAMSEWSDIYYRCFQEGPVAAFDYGAYIRENIPDLWRYLDNDNGQVFWINKTRNIMWSFGAADRMEVVATHSRTLGDLARRYQFERIPAEK